MSIQNVFNAGRWLCLMTRCLDAQILCCKVVQEFLTIKHKVCKSWPPLEKDINRW